MTAAHLTPPQLAELLGIPLGTLRDWHRKGTAPPHYKINGRLIRYRPDEVEAWLAAQHIPGSEQARR